MNNHSNRYLEGLVRELIKRPEQPWLEFKHNNSDAQEIGEYISALSNATVLENEARGYLVWGVDDKTHEIVGTKFSPATKKRGNEPLETWLFRHLEPKVVFRFHEVKIDEKRVIVLEIPRATRTPVTFNKTGYIRVGEVKKKLKEFPEHERELWRALDDTSFEEQIARNRVTDEEVLELLDFERYFKLLFGEQHILTDKQRILEYLERDVLITSDVGQWNITNLGAILLARNLADFPALERKAVRVIQYEGKGKTGLSKEWEMVRGYAAGINELLAYIEDQLPLEKVIYGGVRKSVQKFPIEEAIRELVANALIHQDFSITGTGPIVEIFDDRIEITNPGKPLIDTQQFVNEHPRSRNEKLARQMRLFHICEERGSGIDIVIAEIELRQLPAPTFESMGNSTRVKLFSSRPTQMMSKSEINRACYWHACLKYAESDHLTNASLRARFGIEDKNKATVSRHIREAVKAGLIKPFDKDASRKTMRYVPFWA